MLGADPTDTIAAMSSAPGAAARAVVRLCGERALTAAETVFAAVDDRPLRELRHAERVRGTLSLGELRWPAALLAFRAPRGPTGEDMAELHVVGCVPLVNRLLTTLLTVPGVRAAGPGEFTARAFANGRLDLTAAEGVLAVITSRSAAELRAARRLMDGSAARLANQVRTALINLLAELEAGIDFVEEDIEFLTRGELSAGLALLAEQLNSALSAAAAVGVVGAAATVVLAGRPNVGKTSLLNALAGRAVGIVTDIAGTTRDPVTATVGLLGREVLLVDTAGVESETPGPLSEPDRLAQSAAAARRAGADLTLLVFDAAEGWGPIEQSLRESADAARTVIVAGRADRLPLGQPLPTPAELAVSAHTGQGLPQLAELLAARLAGIERSDGSIGLNARHRAALTAALSAVGRARGLAERAGAVELIALELREAAFHVGSVAGVVVADDILARIFSQFCVGK